MEPRFFATPADFRRWLAEHHTSERELWVGFYKTGSGKLSLTWPEAVDEALCAGWIDGVRKRIDDESYKIRFTPRKPGSTSLVAEETYARQETPPQHTLCLRQQARSCGGAWWRTGHRSAPPVPILDPETTGERTMVRNPG